MKYTDKIIETDLSFENAAEVSISTQQYIDFMKNAKAYKIPVGKKMLTLNVLHTTAGFISVSTKQYGAVASKLADSFIISGTVVDSKGNHFAEIIFKGKQFKISFESFLPKNILEALYAKGIAVSNIYYDVVSLHLQWLLGQFKAKDDIQVLGWQYDSDGKLTWYTEEPDLMLQHYKLSLSSEKEYIMKLNELIKGIPELQLVLCIAAASTLLAYLDITEKIAVPPFCGSLTGLSSSGKTTALMLASSLYESPDSESVFTSFNGTSNALLHMLSSHRGVCICYDETTINTVFNKGSFVYNFTQGKDKLRLNPNSTLKERYYWSCTGLFSGESYIIDLTKNDNLGLGVRVITLDNLTYTRDSDHSNQIKTFARRNYGIIGNMLAKYLLNTDSSQVKTEYENIRNAITKDDELIHCHLTDRIMANYALILYTSEILNDIGIQTDTEAIWSILVNIHNRLSEEANPGKNLVIKIFNYISCHQHTISGIRWLTNKNKKPNKALINDRTFEEILSKYGISDFKTAVGHLLAEGYIVRQSNGRRKAKLDTGGLSDYCYVFDMKKVNEAFGETDIVFKPSNADNACSDGKGDIIHEGNCKLEDSERAICGRAFLL